MIPSKVTTWISVFSRLLLILVSLAVVQAGAAERYRVTLVQYPALEPESVALRLTKAYQGRLEAPVSDDGTFLMELSAATARLLASDPHVARVEPFAVTPNASTSWSLGTYQYDHAGNIKNIGSSVFVYDAEGRLSYEKTGSQKQQALTYDGFGNIRTITEGSAVYTVGADPASNRADVPSAAANHMYGTYDTAGNMVGLGPATYTYDALNVLIRSTTDASRAYVYNASDERIGVITLTGPDGSEVSSQWTVRDPAGQVLRRLIRQGGQWRWMQDYIYRNGKMLASESNDPIKTLHYHLDHLGTPRLITGNGGTEVARHTYYPFGEDVPGPLPQVLEPKKFTGHERDGGGLDYMHARYYSAQWGRFLSLDPVLDAGLALKNPQGWNRYAYVRNNPLIRTDPTGRYECNGTQKECRAFEASLSVVRAAAAEATRKKLEGADRLNKIVKLYGDLNKKNGVTVNFGVTSQAGRMQTSVDARGQVTITVDRQVFGQDVAARQYVSLADGVAHEGDHGFSMRANPSLRDTRSRSQLLDLERSGYRAGGYIYQSLGFSDTHRAIWQAGGGWTPLLEHFANQSADDDCVARGGCTP